MQVCWREVDVIYIAVLDVLHALIVRDAQVTCCASWPVRPSCCDRTAWLDMQSHLLVVWISVVARGLGRLRGITGSAGVHVRFSGRLRGEVSNRRETAIANCGLLGVGDEDVLAVPGEFLIVQ